MRLSIKWFNKNKTYRIVKYILKVAREIDKRYINVLVISSILKALVPFINIIAISSLVDEFMSTKGIERVAFIVIICVTVNLIFSILLKIMTKVIRVKSVEFSKNIKLRIGLKSTSLDFEMIEDPKILDLKEQAIFPIETENAIENLIQSFFDLVYNSILLTISVVTTVVLDFYLLLLIIIGMILSKSLLSKINRNEYKTNEKVIPLCRKFSYYGNLTSDFSIAKDVRLNNMEPLIINKIKSFLYEMVDSLGSMSVYSKKLNGFIQLIQQLVVGIIYIILIYKLHYNYINISNFIVYTSVVNMIISYIDGFLKKYLEINKFAKYLAKFIEYDSIKCKENEEVSKLSINECLQIYNIEFKNVSFKYPRSDRYVLKDINILIKNKEKLSIVGLNGAGKTTFIKLLLGLYKPTKGEILLNGVNINKYRYSEYLNLIGVVFQDYKLFALSIKENIILNDKNKDVDEKIMKILNRLNLDKDIEKTKFGLDTNVYKIFDADGIELSGGQSQKIAIARSVYKDTPIVILDEPTAALDPISESEIYMNFDELMQNKTSIFISHRLGSCKIADNIAVFKDGEIVEYGKHNELINKKGSLYEEMFTTQANYYKTQPCI